MSNFILTMEVQEEGMEVEEEFVMRGTYLYQEPVFYMY